MSRMSDKRPTEHDSSDPDDEAPVNPKPDAVPVDAVPTDEQVVTDEPDYDDGEGHDAIDDGPVEVPDGLHAALLSEATAQAEAAGLG